MGMQKPSGMHEDFENTIELISKVLMLFGAGDNKLADGHDVNDTTKSEGDFYGHILNAENWNDSTKRVTERWGPLGA